MCHLLEPKTLAELLCMCACMHAEHNPVIDYKLYVSNSGCGHWIMMQYTVNECC